MHKTLASEVVGVKKIESKACVSISNNKAFTLIELAIVLAVIGLIAAAVFSGQSLVMNAKLNRVATQFRQYEQAIRAFYAQYDQYPGDFDSAYSFWGSNCASTESDCNGNHDNIIQYNGSGGDSDREEYRFPQHLVLAGILSGSYTGTGSVQNAQNTLPGTIDGSLVYVESEAVFWSTPGKYLTLATQTNSNSWLGTISSVQAKAIDTKIDDGIAHKGRLFGLSGST